MEARWAHNPKAVGSSPTPATNRKRSLLTKASFIFLVITNFAGR